MKFLRTVSTRRLLAIIVGFVTAVAAGTAIAVAAAGSGPVPPPKPLPERDPRRARRAEARRDQGADQLHQPSDRLERHSGIRSDPDRRDGPAVALERPPAAARAPVRQRRRAGRRQQRLLLGLRPDRRTRSTRARSPPTRHKASEAKRRTSVPSIGADPDRHLTRLANHVNLTGAIPSDVAGQAAYTVRVSPKHDGGLLGAGELAWDAIKGVPLRVAVYAKNDSSPVLELKATDISYGPVSSSVFNVAPPGGRQGRQGRHRQGARESATTRAQATPQPPPRASPARRGRPASSRSRSSHRASSSGCRAGTVTLLDWGGHPAALVSYGQNLGGVAVIEQPAASAARARLERASSGGREHHGLSLPTVSINGVTGQELDTALGTVVRFTRGGVTYTVVGSVPAAAADAAPGA